MESTVTDMLGDDESNLLYVVGGFDSINGKYMRGIATWDGKQWNELDHGIDYGLPPKRWGLEGSHISWYKNKLVIGGSFDQVGLNLKSKNVAFWNTDSLKWESCDWNPNGSIYFIHDVRDTTYVLGRFDSIAGKPSFRISYLHQGTWNQMKTPYLIKDFIVMTPYKGNYYLGIYPSFGPTNMNRLVRWDGTQFHVSDHVINSEQSVVLELIEYQDELYVGGSFRKADGNIGNHIMKWDGHQFHNVGDANGHMAGGYVVDLKTYGGRLYACGSFDKIGGKSAYDIACFNGKEWFSLNRMPGDSQFRSGINCMAFLNNSLYVTRQIVIDNKDYFQVLRYNGTLNSISSDYDSSRKISIYPNPANAQITVKGYKTGMSIEVYNSLGEPILTDYNLKSFDVSDWKSGLYFIKVHSKETIKTLKFIKP
tara:strand:+ start:8192 stop:9460 length:1269 start_codon:yes stop_codon:yes gene_type:complete